MNLENIPNELKVLPQWVVWKHVTRDGLPTKLPYQMNGQLAKSNDPQTWGTFDEAVSRYSLGAWAGIGFVFAESDPYCGIDLDGCRDPITGRIADWAREIVLRLKSYTEVSPSETGVKIWVRGEWRHTSHKVEMKQAEQVCEKAPAVEVYDRLRYFAVTGQRLRGPATIELRQTELDALRDQLWSVSIPQAAKSNFRSEAAVIERARKYLAKLPVSVSGQGGHNACFHAACVLCLGFGLGEDDAFRLLSEWNLGCQPPWSEKELRHKIDSAFKQEGDRNYLRNVEPRNFDRIRVPHYKQLPPKPEPRVTTLEAAARQYVDAIRAGRHQLIETGIPELDYAIGGGADFGELFIVAARPSHGKSAVGLQMIHHWTACGLPSAFVSEEMSAISIGKRTLQFVSEIAPEHWPFRIDTIEHDLDDHFRQRAVCRVIESCRTAEGAAEAIRVAQKEYDLKCVVVDYAQLLGSSGKSRYEQITNTSICLRQVASECKVLLVALCQLNRQVENRQAFIPNLSDLRDSGQLEQDADVIVFGVWPHRIDPNEEPHKYLFFVAKNRNRPINQPAFSCWFDPSRQRLEDEKAVRRANYEFAGDRHDPGDAGNYEF